MTTEFEHLDPETIKALPLSKEERLRICREDKWIPYTRAKLVLDKMDEFLLYPRTLRMPSLLIVARGGNGKSAILDQFTIRHPVQITATGEPVAPVLSIEMPETPGESEFWSVILWGLGISHRERDPAHIKKRLAKSGLQYANVRILIIDEFNNLQNMGKRAADLVAAIKGLSNDLKISIIAAGTSEAINALNTDTQMKNRFEPIALNRWEMDVDYRRFLISYEKKLPLMKPSNLASRDITTKIYGMSGDAIGATVKLLKKAACYAIESGEERITLDALQKMEWAGPDHWETISASI